LFSLLFIELPFYY